MVVVAAVGWWTDDDTFDRHSGTYYAVSAGMLVMASVVSFFHRRNKTVAIHPQGLVLDSKIMIPWRAIQRVDETRIYRRNETDAQHAEPIYTHTIFWNEEGKKCSKTLPIVAAATAVREALIENMTSEAYQNSDFAGPAANVVLENHARNNAR